ncbi:MAG: type 1 glutamine amidotransferase [Chloroflexota bacterium]
MSIETSKNAGVLIVNTFPAELSGYKGTSEKTFAKMLGDDVSTRVVSAVNGLEAEVPEQGVILNGSPYSVKGDHEWLEQYREFARAMVESRKKVLGVCFGHQFLAQIYGSAIERMEEDQFKPNRVQLTEEGLKHPLFEGLPEEFPIPSSHFDHVATLNGSMTNLARTTAAPCYAIDCSLGEGVGWWSLQFHPEMNADRLANVIELKSDGIPGWEERQILARQSDFGDFGARIIRNYMKAVIRSTY